MKQIIFVANWKMQKTYEEEIDFFKKHTVELSKLIQQYHTTIIICPSFVGLPEAKNYLSESSVLYGAQDCSSHCSGAYTGEISAQSLAEINCSYCIVGHSERRKNHNESNYIVAQKVKQLQENDITPIVCIGESLEEYKQNKTLERLQKQLDPIINQVKKKISKRDTIYIAYEPLWAIGTGITPTNQEIETIFNYLYNYFKQAYPHSSILLLYGGSVTPRNCNHIALVKHLDGFLIGSASLDFQTLKNIVSLVVSEES